MITTKKDFERFKAEFLRLMGKYSLNGYHVFFRHEPLDGSYASIKVDQSGKSAVAYYSSKLHKDDAKHHNPEGSAKHEVIHLLLSRLSWLGSCRHIMQEDIWEEEEKLVRILEKALQ